jgi:hypothetical protein
MTTLLQMHNPGGVVASLLALPDPGDETIVHLTFSLAVPGRAPRETPFGPEGKANATEILDLVEGLRTMLSGQGFTTEEPHAQ